ncbi:MAG: LysM peptidoglycan-binding domain-containing protein [Halanaerobiaceae bacterium]
MPSHLELANRILERERGLRTLYAQLEDALEAPRQVRAVENLQSLQTRQINVLSNLVEQLEEEQPSPPEERYYALHIVQSGESLRIIAIQYNTTVSQLRRLNPGISMNPQAGTLIRLPIEIPDPPEESFRYVVRRGDTLYQIANRFDTDVETLVRLNSIADPDVIYPGRILIVPD